MSCVKVLLVVGIVSVAAILLLLTLPDEIGDRIWEKSKKMTALWTGGEYESETAVKPTRKPYRGFTYSEKTDAFYKLFSKRTSHYGAERDCKRDFAELIYSNPDDLMMAKKLLNGRNYESGVNRQNDNYGDRCYYINGAGNVDSISCYDDLDYFVCKINASKLNYDDRCKMYYSTDQQMFTPNNLLGSCYYLSDYSASASNAEAECERHGSHLAVINSPREAEFIKQFIKDNYYKVRSSSNSKYVTLGFQMSHTVNGQKIFKSVLGRSLEEEGYDIWSPGEPNNWQNIEDCGSWAVTSPGLNDVPCYFGFSFICEKEMHCDCCTPECLRGNPNYY